MYGVTDIIKAQLARAILNLHTSMPGRVVGYNRAKQTADVQPSIRVLASLPGKLKNLVQLPELRGIPVAQPKGYHANLEAGDHVLLIFCERSLDTWRSSSGTAPVDPGDHRAHSITGAVALPLIARNGEALTSLAGTNAVTLGRNSGSPEFVALANLVTAELNKIRTAHDSHIHATTALVGTGGAVGVIGPASALIGSISSVAASDVKAT